MIFDRRTKIAGGLIAALSIGLALDIWSASRTKREVDRLDEHMRATTADLASLGRAIDSQEMQIHGIAMLYQAAALDSGADQRVVSPDGAMVMFTWRDPQTHKLCAHWCAATDSGDCATFGPDRCLP